MYGIRLFFSEKKTPYHELFAYLTFRKIREIFFLSIKSVREGATFLLPALTQGQARPSVESMKQLRDELFPEVSNYLAQFATQASKIFNEPNWNKPIKLWKTEEKSSITRSLDSIKPIGEIVTFGKAKKKK